MCHGDCTHDIFWYLVVVGLSVVMMKDSHIGGGGGLRGVLCVMCHGECILYLAGLLVMKDRQSYQRGEIVYVSLMMTIIPGT